jgi:hypothetical protein
VVLWTKNRRKYGRRRRSRRLANHSPTGSREWIHICLGLIGNFTFAVGSFLFFSESTKQLALRLFVIGSSRMLIGSVGSALVKYESKQRRDRAPTGCCIHRVENGG